MHVCLVHMLAQLAHTKQAYKVFGTMEQGSENQSRSQQSGLPYLEDQVVLEDKVCDACYEDEEGREDGTPQEDDAVRLWQLHQVGDLKASDVIDRKQSQQGLQAMRGSLEYW